jgi:hypothetical protein
MKAPAVNIILKGLASGTSGRRLRKAAEAAERRVWDSFEGWATSGAALRKAREAA